MDEIDRLNLPNSTQLNIDSLSAKLFEVVHLWYVVSALHKKFKEGVSGTKLSICLNFGRGFERL